VNVKPKKAVRKPKAVARKKPEPKKPAPKQQKQAKKAPVAKAKAAPKVVAKAPQKKNSVSDKPVTVQVKVKPGKKPKPTISQRPSMPVLKVVLCGPHSVHWIPADTVIDPLLMDEGIHPAEVELSKANKVPLRRQEFLRARWLCRRMTKVKEPLLKGPNGEALWPPTVIGSISHKDGHVIAVKVSMDTHNSIGVDLEKVSKVSDQIEAKICNEDESAIVDRVAALGRMPRKDVLALIFSFKESIFKAHFPIGQMHFGFHDVTITEIAYDRREIFARMNRDTSKHSKSGHVTIGFYNWIDYASERYVVVVADERKPLVIDPSLKAELLEEV
jgi:4'-phosphopantetheinyl transferase EntD